jgi:hypothetical protein
MKKKSNYAGLAEENGFGSAQSHRSRWWLVNGTARFALAEKSVIN